MQRVEGRRRQHELGRHAVRWRPERRAEQSDDQAHLAQGRIGEDRLRPALGEPDQDPVIGGDHTERGQERSPELEGEAQGQELHQAEDAGLDDGTRQHGGGRGRGDGVGQRQPDMERHQPRLDAEPGDQKGQGIRLIGREWQGCPHILEQEAAEVHARQEQAREDGDLARDGKGDIDPPGRDRLVRAVVHDQRVGAERDQGEEDVEADHVGRQEDAEIAGERQAPEGCETAAPRVVGHAVPGVETGEAPEQRRHQQKERGPITDRQAGTQEQVRQHEGSAVGHEKDGGETRQRGQRQQAKGPVTPAADDRHGGDRQRQQQRGGQECLIHRPVHGR